MSGVPFRPVPITGVGAVTCAGTGMDFLWNRAVEGRSAIVDGLGSIPTSANERETSRPVLFGLAAIQEAFRQAGWDSLTATDGLIIGTTTGLIELWESQLTAYLKQDISPEELGRAFSHQSLGSVLSTLSAALDFHGPSLLVASACSASTQAIALGGLWIRQKKVRRCLVGGIEVLCRLTVEGFKSLGLLSTRTAAPFDLNRHGINLSEGAAFLCLEEDSETPVAYLSGHGFSMDAYHMTAPHPEGRGCLEAMKQAVATAGLSPSDITWVHAHGTGSPANDSAEGMAIHHLFPGSAPWVSSTKAIHGHALGASGAVETALCLSALQKNTVLPTAGLTTPDPAIPLRHPLAPISAEIRHILKNTLGFGGNNATLILSSPKAVRN